MSNQFIVHVRDPRLGIVGRLFVISTGEEIPNHGDLFTKGIQAGLPGDNWGFQFERVESPPSDIPVQTPLTGANEKVWFLDRTSSTDA
jgi:hypothetical protein